MFLQIQVNDSVTLKDHLFPFMCVAIGYKFQSIAMSALT